MLKIIAASLTLIIILISITACDSKALRTKIDELNATITQLEFEKQILETQNHVNNTKIADLEVQLDSANTTITKLQEKLDAAGKVVILSEKPYVPPLNSGEWGWWEGYAEIGGVDVKLNKSMCKIYDREGNTVLENSRDISYEIPANGLFLNWNKILRRSDRYLFTRIVYGNDATGNPIEACYRVGLNN